MKKVKVILAGGLGNQFFQLVAGEVLTSNLNVPLVVSAHFSQFGRTGHSDWLDAFRIGHEISKSKSRFSVSYLLALGARYARGMAKKFLPAFLHWFYESKVTGYDPHLLEQKQPKTLVGYFQTFEFAEKLDRHYLNQMFSLVKSSNWLTEMLLQLQTKEIVAVHVRRGDYLNEADRYGLLDVGYYREALRILQSCGQTWDEVWVFTDEPDLVEREISPHLGAKTLVIRTPESTHAAESLVLMSECPSLVIANSTFSWWAAYLGAEKRVIYPEPWYRGMEAPASLIPTAWLPAPSEWR